MLNNYYNIKIWFYKNIKCEKVDQSFNINYNIKYVNSIIENIILYFDQSILLYISIINSILFILIIIIYNWYNRRYICINYIHNNNIEIIWTILPILFIIIIIIHNINIIYNIEINKGYTNKSIKIIGNQWYWLYNNLESRIINFNRIILVDQPLFINYNHNINLLISSLDVIHSFSLPSLGIKIDAIPGRISNIFISGLIKGFYIGFCSELCGSGHAFMPINLIIY